MQYLRKVIISGVQHLKDTIPKTQRTANPLHLGLRIQQVVLWHYCSAISRGSDAEGTHVILLLYVAEIVQDHYYCSATSKSNGNNPKDAQDNLYRK